MALNIFAHFLVLHLHKQIGRGSHKRYILGEVFEASINGGRKCVTEEAGQCGASQGWRNVGLHWVRPWPRRPRRACGTAVVCLGVMDDGRAGTRHAFVAWCSMA